jgi:hypothetical protein
MQQILYSVLVVNEIFDCGKHKENEKLQANFTELNYV